MASGRVGGTRSRISGQVGDTYYSARRNSDGSYTQVVSPMPETREDTLTPEVVRQRMLMSICYRYLSALKNILINSFRDKAGAPLNLQEFVRINIPILREKYDSQESQFSPIWFYEYGDLNIYPAPVRISSEDNLPSWFASQSSGQAAESWTFEYATASVPVNYTIEQWMSRYGLKDGDMAVLLLQVVDRDPTRNNIFVTRITINPKVPKVQRLTSVEITDIFDINAATTYSALVDIDGTGQVVRFVFRFTKDDCYGVDAIGGSCILYSAYRDGKWKRSSGQFWTVSGVAGQKVYRKELVDVWDSWYLDRLPE